MNKIEQQLAEIRESIQPNRAHFDMLISSTTHSEVTESPYIRFFMWMPVAAVAVVLVFVMGGPQESSLDGTIAGIVETEVALAEYDDTLIIDNYDDVLDQLVEPLL